MPATVSALPQIAFSRNPINVEITSNDYIETPGVAAVTHIIFSGPVSAGDTIPLLWASADLTLLCALVPDESGDQFPPGAGDVAYVTALLDIFAENYYIDRDFTIGYLLIAGNPSIVLTAKNTGVLFNISEVAGTTSVVAAVTGVNEDLKPSFAHMLQVWVKQAGVFAKVYENNLQLDYPVTGVTTKDISDILNPYVQQVSDRPDLTATGWQLCSNSLLQYYLKTGQYFGDSPSVKKISTTAAAFVNLGGLSVAAALGQTMQGYLRKMAINSNTLCLRQGSKVKTIQPDQPEWLYWINLTGADIDIKVRITINYVSGGSRYIFVSPVTALAWQKYYVPVSYNAININAFLPSGELCASYTAVVVSSAGAYLSQVYTYVIDVFRDYCRYFVYLNSLGGYQTIYTWGKGQNAADRKKTDVEKQVPYATAASTGRFLETDIRLQDKTKVNSGYMYARDITLMKDMLVSTEKYYFFEGRLIPIGFNTTTLPEAMDGDFANIAALEFYPLYNEVVFTDDITLPDNPDTSPGSAGAPAGFDFIVDDDNNTNNLYYDDL